MKWWCSEKQTNGRTDTYKARKNERITEAGPIALFFILLLIKLLVFPSCLLASDNKEAKHFSPCFMSLSCIGADAVFHTYSHFLLPKDLRCWIHLRNRTLLMSFFSERGATHAKLVLTFVWLWYADQTLWVIEAMVKDVCLFRGCFYFYFLNLKSARMWSRSKSEVHWLRKWGL